MNQRFRLSSLIVLLTFLFIICGDAMAATITVTSNADSGSGSLRESVATSTGGDSIVFSPIIYGDTILLSSRIIIDKSLTISGPGPDQLTISGNGIAKVFYAFNPVPDTAIVHISGLRFIDGKSSTEGGAIQATIGELSISDCDFENNEGNLKGGAIYYDGSGPLTLSDSRFIDNKATTIFASGANGGAVWCDAGTEKSVISNCTFSQNQAERGGAVYCYGNAYWTRCSFSSNSATSGGALYLDGSGIVQISACSLDSNEVSGGGVRHGGAVYATNNRLTIFNSTISGNKTVGVAGPGFDQGGGIYADALCILEIDHCTITQNHSSRDGGGLYVRDSVIITQSIIAQNTSVVFGPDLYTDLSGSMEFPVSGGYNILGNNSQSAFPASVGDTIGTSSFPLDALLDSLGYYGGNLYSHRPGCGSPALDRGNPGDTVSTDIRGSIRPLFDESDIGSHEREEECCDPHTAPAGLSTFETAGSVELSWDRVPVSLGCQVKASEAGSGVNTYQRVVAFEPTQFNVPSSALDAGTTYIWKVRCACDLDPLITTPFSEPDTFVTSVLRQINEVSNMQPLIDGQHLNISPSMVSGPSASVNISTISLSGHPGRLIIYDASGIPKISLDKTTESSINLSVDDLHTGVYTAVLQTKSRLAIGRFIVY